jgi:hypothetical protein
MEFDGCMYVDENVYCQPINLENQFDAVASESESTSSDASGFESSGTGTECCICYEIIGKKNNCVTDCGHVFCFKCLAVCMTRKNTCPCCRAILVDELENQDNDEEDEEEDDEDYEDEDEDEVEEDDEDEIFYNNDYDGDIEDVVAHIESKDITMLDIVSVLFNKFSKKDEKYNTEYVKNLCETLYQINSDTESESKEREQMHCEDSQIVESHQEIIVDKIVEITK